MKKLLCLLVSLLVLLSVIPAAQAATLVEDADCSRILEHPVYEYNSKTKKYTKTGEVKEYSFRIPHILLESPETDALNQTIQDKYVPIMEAAADECADIMGPMTSGEIKYNWSVNGDILSLIIGNYDHPEQSGSFVYEVHNLSISEGKVLSRSEFLEVCGLTEKEYKKEAVLFLEETFEEMYTFYPEPGDEFYTKQLKATVDDENIEETALYLDENGQLHMVAWVYAMAGGSRYMHDLVMSDMKVTLEETATTTTAAQEGTETTATADAEGTETTTSADAEGTEITTTTAETESAAGTESITTAEETTIQTTTAKAAASNSNETTKLLILAAAAVGGVGLVVGGLIAMRGKK